MFRYLQGNILWIRPLACANELLLPHNLQWIPELKHYAPGVPIVLVGTKLGQDHTCLFCFNFAFQSYFC